MGTKRKRPACRRATSSKRSKVTEARDGDSNADVDHPVLRHYFPRVTTLREHLRKDLQDRSHDAKAIARIVEEQLSPVAKVLDTVIVGYRRRVDECALRERRAKDVISFTQQLPSSTIGSTSNVAHGNQLEVIDFIIWLLFRRSQPPSKPQHLLSQGFDRLAARGEKGLELSVAPGIPGIISKYPNQHIEYVTSTAWCALLALLGKGGDIVMVDLLLECCLFLPASENSTSLVQFSGISLSSLQPYDFADKHSKFAPQVGPQNNNNAIGKPQPLPRIPSAIKFVRNRMFFAQPTVSGNGKIKFGLHKIHVLNRCENHQDETETIHVLKYMFPRQFRLHNAFISPVDPRESALPFKDYTLRESEIKKSLLDKNGNIDPVKQTRLPKRLLGMPLELVKKLRKLHSRCGYVQLLKYYCSLFPENESFLESGQMPAANTDLATPSSRVSAFCQAVIKRVIPHAFWGAGPAGEHNQRLILKNVDLFLRARKFEAFTLQTFLNGLKISAMSWLALPNHEEGQHMSATDFAKRKELLAEFIYYLFDSFLIPLVRSNFHLTESNVHRNRLFYFRHDVWRALCAPALDNFKNTLFEELNAKETKQRLVGRPFGYSTVRLLPKATGFRPITNLRRRPYVWVNGKRMLGRSINSALNPAFRALNYEKTTHLNELGCSLFSVGDIYPRLREFADRLKQLGFSGRPLYFAKVDVQACFDTIPQKAVLRVVNTLLSTPEYVVAGEAIVKPPEPTTLQKGRSSLRPVVKFGAKAKPVTGYTTTNKHADTAPPASTVLVQPLGQQSHRQHAISFMLEEHVSFNLIKLGKKFYRQKQGIPQGSVLSSLLCNFFYGALERSQHLAFLREHAETCLLLRLVDDFLLISLDRDVAERFLGVMHEGIPEFGVEVKPAKSLVSFDYEDVGGLRIARAEGGKFPYCGLEIDMRTLDIGRGGALKPGTTVADSLTVEGAVTPGRMFRRKALNALKIQMHAMYFDTSFNSLDTALANLYKLFRDAAARMESYIRGMPKGGRPAFATVKSTIEDVTQLAYSMLRRRQTRGRDGGNIHHRGAGAYECAIRREQAVCIAHQAFRDVFLPRQTKHSQLLDWLRHSVRANWPRSRAESNALMRVVPSMRT